MAASTDVGIRELLEAGVHFGHQTRRWNPKMRRFIWGERGGIYIIDLLQTERLLRQAQEFVGDLAARGGTVLFVGTKKQARDAIKGIAEESGMPYVNHRWLGGVLTNFQTISQRIKRLHDLERYEAEGQLSLLPTRERMAAEADLTKLRANLGGVADMRRQPDAIFIVDLRKEQLAVREARRLGMPVIALVVDEAAHLRVPAARLVAEVNPGFQQLLDAYLGGQRKDSLVCLCRVCPPVGSRTRAMPGQGHGRLLRRGSSRYCRRKDRAQT